jgi:hypothetical protein
LDANRLSPSVLDRCLAASWPLTLFPAPSSSGENVPRPPLPGETAMIPPPIPLFPGTPTSNSQSPEVSYIPAVAMTASTCWQTAGVTTCRPVSGLTPPSASVALISARSSALVSRQLCRVYRSTASAGSA